MKKQFLLLVGIAVFSLAQAQLKPSFGVRAGLSSSRLRGDAVNSLKNVIGIANGMITTGSRTGFFAGSYATVPFGKILSVEPALYYSQKGYEMRGALNLKGLDFLDANAKANLNTQYIDMPVLLKVDVNGFQIFAGPQISYLVQADLKTTAGALGFNLLNNNINVVSQLNRWDAGVTGGASYQFANGINVMAAYDYGLSKADAGKNSDSYNRSFKIGVGFRIK